MYIQRNTTFVSSSDHEREKAAQDLYFRNSIAKARERSSLLYTYLKIGNFPQGNESSNHNNKNKY